VFLSLKLYNVELTNFFCIILELFKCPFFCQIREFITQFSRAWGFEKKEKNQLKYESKGINLKLQDFQGSFVLEWTCTSFMSKPYPVWYLNFFGFFYRSVYESVSGRGAATDWATPSTTPKRSRNLTKLLCRLAKKLTGLNNATHKTNIVQKQWNVLVYLIKWSKSN